LSAREGIIVNAYTEAAYRRRGLARALMTELLAWTEANHLEQVVLHASIDGRPLYEQFGFRMSNEMKLIRSNFSHQP